MRKVLWLLLGLLLVTAPSFAATRTTTRTRTHYSRTVVRHRAHRQVTRHRVHRTYRRAHGHQAHNRRQVLAHNAARRRAAR